MVTKSDNQILLFTLALVGLAVVLVPIVFLFQYSGLVVNVPGGGRPLGAIAGITAILLFAGVLAAIVVVAMRLNRAVSMQLQAGDLTFPRPNQEILLDRADLFIFEQTPPRKTHDFIVSRLLAGVVPGYSRWLVLATSFLLILMVVICYAIFFQDIRNVWLMWNGPVFVSSGEVLDTVEKSSRSGKYYRVRYAYGVSEQAERLTGVSFAKSPYAIGSHVDVHVLSHEPQLSVIAGASVSPVSLGPLLFAIAMSILLPPGFWCYFLWRRAWFHDLVINGLLLQGNITRLKAGGRGHVFVYVSFHIHDMEVEKELICPAIKDVFSVLEARRQARQPVLLLAHPTRYRHAYLVEPHLDVKI